MVSKVGLNKQQDETADVILKLYELFLQKDALLIEVNPYAESISTGGCKCIFLHRINTNSLSVELKTNFYYSYIFFSDFCLDAKFRFDDNAEFRQKDLFALRDWSQEDEKEVEASKHNLNYIALDGNYKN